MKSARNKNHATSACVSCRKRKTKCDEVHPVCSSCAKKGRDCEWTPDSDRRTARGRKCEDCAAWRVKCAEIEARLAVFEGRAERPVGLSSAGHSPQPLSGAPDSAGSQSAIARNAQGQRYFQEPLFPLRDEPIAGLHPVQESTLLSGNNDATFWLAGTATTLLPDAAPYAELDGLYSCPFATAAPSSSSFHHIALDHYAGLESATEDGEP